MNATMRASKVCISILSHVLLTCFIYYILDWWLPTTQVSTVMCLLTLWAAGLRIDTNNSSEHPVLARVVLSVSSAIPDLHGGRGLPMILWSNSGQRRGGCT